LVIDTSGLVAYDLAGLVGVVESLDQARLDEVPVAVSSLAPADEQILREVSTQQDLEVRIFPSLDEAVDEMLSGPEHHGLTWTHCWPRSATFTALS
jgi:anti-anti-sigma regulatory factor